jgi:hypothetical protein
MSSNTPGVCSIDAAALDRARDAATYLGAYVADAPVRSIAELVTAAVHAEVDRLENNWHDGVPFPPVVKRPRRPRIDLQEAS